MEKNSDQPAFARPYSQKEYDGRSMQDAFVEEQQDLTKREYACIKLGIPDTGDKELDEIILKAERKRIAGLAMQGILASLSDTYGYQDESKIVQESISKADDLLKQLNKK